MKILVVGINYAPENIGCGKYNSEMCEWLAAQGHEVRVVTTPPYYPAWRIWEGQKIRWPRLERLNGVEVLRCPLWVPQQPRGLTRMLHLASFALSSALGMALSARWKPQVVINIAPTLASAPGAWLYARLMRARCWLHVQDFEVDAAMDMGIVQPGRLRRAALWIERRMLRRFDRVSTISPKMLERLEQKGVDRAKRVLFPNWVDTDAICPLDAASPYRAELGIPDDAVVALYSGNMGQKQGLELLGEAARALAEHPSLHFVFGGEGPARETLQLACRDMANVHFLDLQPTARLNDWLGLADIHLLPQRADVADLVMPSKMTGMLASGRPTLATAYPETGVANALAESGVVVPPADLSAFVTALEQLASDKALCRALGSKARQQAATTLSCNVMLTAFQRDLCLLLRLPQIPDEPTSTTSQLQDPA